MTEFPSPAHGNSPTSPRRSPSPGLLAAPAEEPITNPIARLSYWIFLWLPNEQAPGLGSLCIAALRLVALPMSARLVVITVSLAVPSMSHGSISFNINSTPSDYVQYLFYLIPIATQELGRYSFYRRSMKPVQSLSFFTAMMMVYLIYLHFSEPYVLAWTIGAQIIASTALVFALRHKRFICVSILAVLIFRTALVFAAPRLPDILHAEANASAVQQSATSKVRTNKATAVPPPDELEDLVRVYPDAILNKTWITKYPAVHKMAYTADYDTQASPGQINQFYRNFADNTGLKDGGSIGSFHYFKREGSGDSFGYSIYSKGNQLIVSFTAEADSPSPK